MKRLLLFFLFGLWHFRLLRLTFLLRLLLVFILFNSLLICFRILDFRGKLFSLFLCKLHIKVNGICSCINIAHIFCRGNNLINAFLFGCGNFGGFFLFLSLFLCCFFLLLKGLFLMCVYVFFYSRAVIKFLCIVIHHNAHLVNIKRSRCAFRNSHNIGKHFNNFLTGNIYSFCYCADFLFCDHI